MKRISVRGDIIQNGSKWVYEWLGIDATCPADVLKALEDAAGDDVEVDINSGGGEITAGSEIYTILRSYQGNVLINILGLAASAASVIAAARKSRISPTALLMIHNTSTSARGDHQVFDHQAEMLREADQAIANAYKEKTGMSDDDLKQLMDNETWMSADRAVSLGFVDEVMFQESAPVIYNGTTILREETISKIRGIVKQPTGKQDQAVFLNAKLNYLKKVRKQ